MNTSRTQGRWPSAQSPDMINLRMETDGSWITLRCRACGHPFETFHTTVAGVTTVRCPCPQCHTINEVGPDDFEGALDRYLPARDMDEIFRLTEEATRIAETWYRVAPLARLLDYKGVNLGEGPERELVAFIVQGLLKATEKGGGTDGR